MSWIEPMAPLVGADGCKGGWVAALMLPGEEPQIAVFPSFADIVKAAGPQAIIAVDMPIGLPDRVGHGGRGPERLVRPLLGGRQSSVFSIPSRAAVEGESPEGLSWEQALDAHRRASAVARATSDPPRGVSIQSFFLFPKIRELDALLRADPALAERVIESHPEVAFGQLNGGQAMSQPKKIKGRVNPAGMEERRALLERCGLATSLLRARQPAGAGEDDCLDAMACLMVAGRFARGETVSFPDPPGRDRYGLPVAIRA